METAGHPVVAAAVRLGCLLLIAGSCALAALPSPSGAATSGTVVGATVPSATSINAAGCAAGTAGSTELGTLQPGGSVVASADCSVVFGSSNDTAMLRVFQSDRIGNAFVMPADGRFDTGFDGDGKVVNAIGAGAEAAMDVAVQTDGKVVVAGYASSGGTRDFLVMRYEANGTLDPTFDGDGIAVTTVLAAADQANAVAIQSDGRILAAGQANNGTDDEYAIVRYEANGTLDTTFDGDGRLVLPASVGQDRIEDMALQSNGRIVVVGRSDTDALLARVTTAGVLDTTFDGDGYRPESIGGSGLRAVAIQPDGRIVSGGGYFVGGFYDYVLFRHETNGTRDILFDTDGRQNVAFSGSHDYLNAIAVLEDGRIVVAGNSWGSSEDVTLVRLDAAGVLDPTFDGDGKVITTMPQSESAMSMTALPDGRIVVVGNEGIDVLVSRYRTDGSLDPTWGGGDGQVVFDVIGSDVGEGIAQLADGKLFVAGSGSNAADVTAARFDAAAIADWAAGGTDWTLGANTFGACLRSVAGAGVIGAWTVDPDATCTGVNADPWNRIQPGPADAGSTIARSTTSSTTAATANMRFGARASASQRPGTYRADIVFEVVAPSA